MNLRQYMMRLHTSHGMTPHWNARFSWIVITDAMGVAMVSWALTGLIMWWQIKRTRRIGFVVILLSLITASTMFGGMQNFYATTVL